MALIDLKTNLADKVGEKNTDDGTFKVKQGDNTERKTNFTEEQIDQQYTKLSPDDGQLVVREIGERYDNRVDAGFIRGGITTNLDRTGEDIERIGKFLETPKGNLFIGKQVILQKLNPSEQTRNYKPSSIITNLPSLVRDERHKGTGFLSGLNPFNEAPTYTDRVNKGKTSEISENDKIFEDEKIGSISGIRRFLNTLTGKNKKLSFEVDENLSQKPYGGEFGNIKKFRGDDNLPKDFIKFRIRDAVNGKWIIFPAFITDISDNSAAEYNQFRYIGRADSVHVYQGYSRTISLGFSVVAFSKEDVPIIWEKINALKGLTLPTYKPFYETDAETRPVAPYIYLTIGDLFNNTPGYFSSVGISIPQRTTWELDDGLQYPHLCDVTLEFTFIGKNIPNTLGKNYDLPWLKDNGVGDGNFGVFNGDPKDSKIQIPDRTKYKQIDGR